MKPDDILLEFFKGYYATGEGGLDISVAERECARVEADFARMRVMEAAQDRADERQQFRMETAA